MRANTLQIFRQIHLYLGLFTAPALLFFAFTGILQTFSLHEASRDGSYQPPAWIVRLAEIHKKQTLQIPPRKTAAVTSARSGSHDESKRPHGAGDQGPVEPPAHNTLPLKIFFLAVALGLFTSTISGLYMSWKYRRSKLLQVALVLAGIVVPLVLLTV